MINHNLARVVSLIIVILAAGGLLVACNIGDLTLPTALPLPRIYPEGESIKTPAAGTTPDESPRRGPGIDLPPTWTPASVPVQTPVLPVDSPPNDDSNQTMYVVQTGDSLAGIAIQFGIEMDLLVQANNITDPDHIEVGQELIIPLR